MKDKKGMDIMLVLALIFGVGVAATSLTEDKSKPYVNQTLKNINVTAPSKAG